MEFEISGFGLPGYDVARPIFNQRNLILRSFFPSGLRTDITKLHIKPNHLYLIGKAGLAVVWEYDKPNNKTVYGPFEKNLSWNITPGRKTDENKLLKRMIEYCVDHNIWMKRQPKTYLADLKARKVIEHGKTFRLRITPGDSDQSVSCKAAHRSLKAMNKPIPQEGPGYWYCPLNIGKEVALEIRKAHEDAYVWLPRDQDLNWQ